MTCGFGWCARREPTAPIIQFGVRTAVKIRQYPAMPADEDSNRIEVRPAILPDAGSIARIHVEASRAAFSPFLDQETMEGLPSVADRVRHWQRVISDEQGREAVHVAASSGRVVGFVSFGPTRDEVDQHPVGEVYAVYVDPAHQRRGVGSRLLRDACRALRDELGVPRATLWCMKSNDRTRLFYEAEGWSVDGAKSGHTVDEVRYALQLR